MLTAAAIINGLGITCALLVLGRTLLSLLPPGAAGSHRTGDLPLTLALSLVLGALGTFVTMAWLERCGVDSIWPLAILWTSLPLLRFWLRPHAFVPRHAWPERESLASKAALFAVFAASCWPVARALIETRDFVDALLRSAGLGALAAIVLHSLREARRTPLGRRIVVLLLLTTPALQRNIEALGLAAVVAAALGVAFLVAWLRRGDERAAVLSAIGFASLTLCANAAWIGGLGVLVLATHADARRRVLTTSVIALVVIGVATHSLGDGATGFPLFDDAPLGAPVDGAVISETSLLGAIVDWRVWSGLWIALGLALVALAIGVRGGRRAETPHRPGRELVAVVVVLIATLALHVLAHAVDLNFARELRDLDAGQELVLLVPAAALIIGLVLAPSENSLETR